MRITLDSTNKAAFDLLLSHKNEIEATVGASLTWERADEYKSSLICYHLRDVRIANEAVWPRMAEFHAQRSDGLCSAVLPYLEDEGL